MSWGSASKRSTTMPDKTSASERRRADLFSFQSKPTGPCSRLVMAPPTRGRWGPDLSLSAFACSRLVMAPPTRGRWGPRLS
jgi:hypothetical protein